jgi:hypothetical protein
MSLMRCRSCSTRFAVGLLRCPQCQVVSELYARPEHEAEQEEAEMPKITVGGGASNALADTEEVAVPATDVPEETALAEAEPDAAGDEQPDGGSKDVEPEAPPAKPARKAAAKKTAAPAP